MLWFMGNSQAKDNRQQMKHWVHALQIIANVFHNGNDTIISFVNIYTNFTSGGRSI